MISPEHTWTSMRSAISGKMHEWVRPPSSGNLTLPRNETHLWRVVVKTSDSEVQMARQIISPEECARACRFRFQQDHHRYIFTRAALRCILARYLCCFPETLHFRYGPFGKPYFPAKPCSPALQFSLSHTKGLALCAVSWSREVGVDVERVHSDPALARIVRRLLTSPEQAMVREMEKWVGEDAFFYFWTRKEACIKALGTNLHSAVGNLSAVNLLSDSCDAGGGKRWSLVTLRPAHGFLGTVAMIGRMPRIRYWQWGSPVSEVLC
jgi:4'-phosphopantetheinyl transferase